MFFLIQYIPLILYSLAHFIHIDLSDSSKSFQPHDLLGPIHPLDFLGLLDKFCTFFIHVFIFIILILLVLLVLLILLSLLISLIIFILCLHLIRLLVSVIFLLFVLLISPSD